MRIEDGKIVLDEGDKEFLAHMISLNMLKDITSVPLRQIAQVWYERGQEDLENI